MVCVLLIACANAANLLQARTETRRTEFAVRASLGAGRRRLMRQLLVESGLLGLAGGALGIALTFAGIRLFRGLAGDFPNASSVNVDIRVLLFTMAVSFATAIVMGSAPAFQAARTDLNLALREGRRATTTGIAGRRKRHILAVSEIALALVLLVGAGLMINSVLRMQQVNPGFDPANVINFDLSVAEGAPYVERLPDGDIERATPLVSAFYRQLLDKVTAIPGVESAGTVTPFGFGYNFSVLGCPLPPPDKMPITGYKEIKPHFVPNVENSAEKGPLSERLRPGRRAVGRGRQRDFRTTLLPKRRSHRPAITAEIYRPGPKATSADCECGRRREMVLARHTAGPGRLCLLSAARLGLPRRKHHGMAHLAQTLVVRSASSLGNREAGLAAAVKKAVAELDPDQPVTGIMTMEQSLARSVGDAQFYARLLEILAIIALLLAAIGIYGSMSYFVTERTHEIGIRVALGAQRANILGLVTRTRAEAFLYGSGYRSGAGPESHAGDRPISLRRDRHRSRYIRGGRAGPARHRPAGMLHPCAARYQSRSNGGFAPRVDHRAVV